MGNMIFKKRYICGEDDSPKGLLQPVFCHPVFLKDESVQIKGITLPMDVFIDKVIPFYVKIFSFLKDTSIKNYDK